MRYYFDLKQDMRFIRDPEGTELLDDSSARAHAEAVAKELMANNTRGARTWRLQVYDDQRHHRFELLFASIDPSIARLPPELQTSICDVCRTTASLTDAISDVRVSLLRLRATLARADGAPYLASLHGVQL